MATLPTSYKTENDSLIRKVLQQLSRNSFEDYILLKRCSYSIEPHPLTCSTKLAVAGTFQTPIEINKRNRMNWLPSGILDNETKDWTEVRFKNNDIYFDILLELENLNSYSIFNYNYQKENTLIRSIQRQICEFKKIYSIKLKQETERSQTCLAPMIMMPTHIKENDITREILTKDLIEKFDKKEAQPYDMKINFGQPLANYSAACNTATTTFNNYETTGIINKMRDLYFNEILTYYNFAVDTHMPEGIVILHDNQTNFYDNSPTTWIDNNPVSASESFTDPYMPYRVPYYEQMVRYEPPMYNPRLFGNFSPEEWVFREKQQKGRQAERESAESKAQKLLKDMVNEVDFRKYKEKGYIIVKGESGRVYRIWSNTMIDVYELEVHQQDYLQHQEDSQRRIIKPNRITAALLKEDKLTLRRKLCIHSPSKTLPDTDEVILKLLLARNDEKRLLEMSHHFMQNNKIAIAENNLPDQENFRRERMALVNDF